MISGPTAANGEFGQSNATGVATEQEQQATQNQQFWDQIYSQFNPQAQVFSTPSSAPGFQGAAKNAQGFAQSLGQVGGGTGSVDMGQANAKSNAEAGQLTRSQDLNSYLNDTQKNMNESDTYQGNAFNRMNGIFGSESELNRLPQERELNQAETADKENEQWQNYENGLNPAENLVGGAVGGFLGHMGGRGLFSQANNGNYEGSLNDINNEVDNLPQP